MKKDNVNHPAHYTQGKIEAIDAMESAFGSAALADYCRIAAFKYLWRSSKKGAEMEDLQKAAWYLDKAIRLLAQKSKKTKKHGVVSRVAKKLAKLGKRRRKTTALKPATQLVAVKQPRQARRPKATAPVVQKPKAPPAPPPVPGTEAPKATRKRTARKPKEDTTRK